LRLNKKQYSIECVHTITDEIVAGIKAEREDDRGKNMLTQFGMCALNVAAI